MFHLLFRAAIAAPIVAYLVPLLASSRPRAGERPAGAAAPAQPRRGRSGCSLELQREWSAHEFAFGRAIEEYEELIDRTVGRLP
jgi:hypothetical protein